MVKIKKQKTLTFEKPLAISGTALALIGSLSSLYYLYINQRFVHDPLSLNYYLNYLILLGGGFAVGYLLTRRGSRLNKMLIGSTYALIALTIYSLLFPIRIGFEALFGMLPFPWTRIAFEGAPLFALIATIVIAYFLQLRPRLSTLGKKSLWTLIVIFFTAQSYDIVMQIYYYFSTTNVYDISVPVWLVISSYLLNPTVITFAAYLSFNRIKSFTSRLFAASFVGLFSSTLMYILWNFHTNPTIDATNVFQTFVFMILALADALLILKIRQAAK